MANCPAFDPAAPYVSEMVRFVDCHSLALGMDGYAALGPGTAFGMALSGLLTIYVALIGWRLLLGGEVTLRHGVSSALRLGVVLALATQWSAYQPLVYDVITGGPADLAARVLAPGGLGGDAPRQLIDRVQGAHAALGELAQAPAPAVVSPTPDATLTASPAAAATAMPAEARSALIWADRLLVSAALTGTLSVRVAAALLLALGPLFIACLLFEATRGLFIGWVRVMVGAALAGVAAQLVIALELAVIEPQVLALRALVAAQAPPGPLPQDLLASSLCFALVMLVALIALARTAAAFRLPAGLALPVRDALRVPFPVAAGFAAAHDAAARNSSLPERNRAEHIADAARASERRWAALPAGDATRVAPLARRDEPWRHGEASLVAPLPLGQAGRRAHRQSAAAGRRDASR